MRIIIVGMGETGKHLAKVLSAEQHDVTIIDRSAEAVAWAEETLDVMTLVGHGASPGTLDKAQVASSDLLLAVTDDDEVNILCALTAKRMGAGKVVARISSSSHLDLGDRGRLGELLSLDLVICQQEIAALEIERLIKSYGALSVEAFFDNRLLMIQMELKPNLPILGRPIRDLGLPGDSVVAGLLRAGEMIVPTPVESLQAGDQVFLFGTLSGVSKLESMMGRKGGDRARKVIIVGGGEVGLSITRIMLQEGIEVVLIDHDLERCRELSSRLDGVSVIHGDGTNLALLQEELGSSTDIFVAVSGDDDTNLMSTLLAKHLGVSRTVCMVSRSDYVPIYQALGVDATVSPRLSAANRILKFLRSGEVVSDIRLADGAAEILEATPAPGSPILGKRFRDLNLPKGVMIVGILGSSGVRVPAKGDEVVKAGDSVVLFCLSDVRASAERLLRKRFLSL